MLTIALTIFKFFGILISAAGALISTLKEKATADRRLPRFLTRHWATRWVIIGLLVAVTSTFLETIQSNTERRQADIRTAEDSAAKSVLLSNLLAQLAYVQRIVGEFDTLAVEVTAECLTNDLDVRAFQSGVQSICEGIPQPEEHPAPADTFTNMSQNMVGWVHGSGTTGFVLFDLRDDGNCVLTFPLSTALSKPGFGATHPAVVECLGSPALAVGLFSRYSPDYPWLVYDHDGMFKEIRSAYRPFAQADFRGFGQPTTEPDIALYRPSGRITITWHFDVPRDTWVRTFKMTSIMDIPEATVRLCFTNWPPKLRLALRPIAARLLFDKGTISATNFWTLPQELDSTGPDPFHPRANEDLHGFDAPLSGQTFFPDPWLGSPRAQPKPSP
jgi:hypothetical protein